MALGSLAATEALRQCFYLVVCELGSLGYLFDGRIVSAGILVNAELSHGFLEFLTLRLIVGH